MRILFLSTTNLTKACSWLFFYLLEVHSLIKIQILIKFRVKLAMVHIKTHSHTTCNVEVIAMLNISVICIYNYNNIKHFYVPFFHLKLRQWLRSFSICKPKVKLKVSCVYFVTKEQYYNFLKLAENNNITYITAALWNSLC